MSTITLTTQGGLRKAQVRAVNERVLLNLIRQTPGISRSDIVRITGFSSSSVTFIVSRMIRDGLLCEADVQAPPQVGRRPVALRLRPEAMTAIGVEVARPEARIIVAGLHGEPLRRRVVPWQADPKLFLGRVRDAIRALAGRISGKRLLGVGVSLPGTIDRTTGKVIAAENLGWFDLEAGRMLSEGVPANFYFENNAKLGALAERWFCQPGSKPLENFVFVMARGGLGTGVIIEGKLLHGASGEASEFGHTILYPDGRRCVCGNSGCWEEYASDRALERLYAERRGIANGVEKPDADEIVRLGRNGDELALAVLRETAAYVGMGFANLNAALNPEAIVVGDYLASGWDLLKDWVWEALRRRAPQRYLHRLRIIPARHVADSTVMGALALALSQFFTQSGCGNGKGGALNSVSVHTSA